MNEIMAEVPSDDELLVNLAMDEFGDDDEFRADLALDEFGDDDLSVDFDMEEVIALARTSPPTAAAVGEAEGFDATMVG